MATTQVRTKQQLLVTDNLSFQSSYRITNLVDPSAAQDAATKAYVDAVKTGLDFKDSARVATTGAETYTISGGAVTQITGTSIDGVSLSIGDRILIKNAPAATGAGAGAGTANTTQPANGVYTVSGNTTNLTVARSTDADSNAEVTSGMYVFVSEGSTQADNGYVLTTNDTITLNTTGLTFTQFSGAGQITAGAGLTKTGNTIDAVGTTDRITVNPDSIDIASTYVGQTSIVTLGTVTTGTWSATTIATTRGGTGLTSYVLGDLLYASAANTLAALAGNTLASKRFLTQTGTGAVSAAPSWGTIVASDIGSGAALTKTDDTNVTLTLGGSPTTALLAATSLTLGWTGTLGIARGGTGASTKTTAFNALTPMTTLGDTDYHDGTNAVRLAGNTTTTKQFLSQTGTGTISAAPAWSTIAGSDITGAALTKTDDTNVTLTLGGTPSTALLRAASITVGWSGILATTRGGTGLGSYTLGDTLYASAANTLSVLAGNITATKQFLSQTGTGAVSAAPAWSSIAGSDVTGAALTKTDDTNVTLTLGGTPTTALLRAASLTLGWTGTLAVARGGTGAASFTAYMPVAGGTTSTGALQSVAAGTTTGQPLTYQGAAALPTFAALNLAGGANIVTGTLPVGNGGTGQSSYVNGELLIGNSTGNTLTKATLTQGSGISITNGNGSITIAVTGVLTSASFVVREIPPTGAVNGTNPTFTLANTPTAGTEQVFVNGVLQNVGAGNDYTISGATITFQSGAIPQTGDVVLVNYLK